MTTRPQPPREELGFQDDKPSKTSMSTAMPYLIMAVIALVAAFAINSFFGVSKTDFTKNMGNVATDIAAIKTANTAAQDNITATLAGIPNTVDAKISPYTNRISSLESSMSSVRDATNVSTIGIKDLKTTNETLIKSMADLQLVIDQQKLDNTAMKTLVDSYKADITTLKADNAILKTDLTTAKADIVTLKADVAKLKAGTGTTDTTTPAVVGVTATLIGTSSMPLVNGTNTINITIANNTTKATYAEQINIQLQFLNPSTAISTWGLTLTSAAGTFNTPSYSIVNGTVTYLMNAGLYMSPGTTQTLSIIVTAATPPVQTINFVTTLAVNGFSALQ